MLNDDERRTLAVTLRGIHHRLGDSLLRSEIDALLRVEAEIQPASRRAVVFAFDGAHFVAGFEGQTLKHVIPERVGGWHELACLHRVVAARGEPVPFAELGQSAAAVRGRLSRAIKRLEKIVPAVGAVLRAGLRTPSTGAAFHESLARDAQGVRFIVAGVHTTLPITNR